MIEPSPAALQHRLCVACDVVGEIGARSDRGERLELDPLNTSSGSKGPRSRKSTLRRNDGIITLKPGAQIERQSARDGPSVVGVRARIAKDSFGIDRIVVELNLEWGTAAKQEPVLASGATIA